jgi:hypothetical protein
MNKKQKQYWEKQAAEGWMPRDWDYPWPKKIGPFVLDIRPGKTPHPLTAEYHAEARRENKEGEWVYMVALFQIDWTSGKGFTIYYEGEAVEGEGDDAEYEESVWHRAARKTKEGALDVVRRQVEAITRTNRKRLPDWLDTIHGTGLK